MHTKPVFYKRRANKIAALGLLCATCVLGADPTLDALLKSVENRYNHAQSLKLDFTETYKAPKRAVQVDSGVLSLRKPGRMRWDYASPKGKLFVSDGKDVFLYIPDANRVEHSRFKESEDLRAPLAFLLGKLNFYKEFRKFNLRTETDGTWIDAEPNSNNLPYSQVQFLIGPDSGIRRLRVVGQDQSVMDFVFDREQLNVPLDAKLFSFRPPPGAELIETEP
jgi:outer membrane lipoprotein carrier protein